MYEKVAVEMNPTKCRACARQLRYSNNPEMKRIRAHWARRSKEATMNNEPTSSKPDELAEGKVAIRCQVLASISNSSAPASG